MKTSTVASLIAAIAVLLFLPRVAQAQLTILHSFGDGSVANDGNNPATALVGGGDGYFYGTTYNGGSVGYGTVYKMDASGNVTILHSFGDGSIANDGVNPDSELLLGTDGNFYGTCQAGGSAASCGTVYKITPSGTETVLHVFDYNDGSIVQAGLVPGPDGDYYGNTYGGGSGHGTIYKIDSSGNFTSLFDLSATGGNSPRGTMIFATDGNFYGVCTAFGSKTTTSGSVFRFTPSGTYSDVFVFGKTNYAGQYPIAGVVMGSDNKLWGTTYYGGYGNYGTIYSMNTLGTTVTFHGFDDDSSGPGANPAAALLQASDGKFYGTTSAGGVSVPASGEGVLFNSSLPLSNNSVSDLHNFGDGSVPNDGFLPVAALIQGPDGYLYGTTDFGGSTFLYYNPGLGAAFKYNPTATSPPFLIPYVYIDGPIWVAPGVPVECVPIYGKQFCSGAQVLINGETELQAAFLGPTELLAFIPTDLMTGPTFTASVILPSVGSQPGEQSNTATFSTQNPAPTLSGFGPGTVTAGKQVKITVRGKNLLQNSSVLWDGAALPTLWISNKELQANVTPAPEPTGFAQLQVSNPAPGGGISQAEQVIVVATTLTLKLKSLDLSPASGLIDANLTVKNVGPGVAQNVQITLATLGGVAPVTALPVNLGTISPGGSANATVSFSPSIGTAGQKETLVVSGSFVGPANGSFLLTITKKLP